MSVLVVAAHPDDEILGCGATAARFVDEGISVHFAILGEGATARAENRRDANQSAVAALGESARDAATIIGATVSQHGLPDNRFDSLDLLDVVKIVEQLVSNWRPTMVFTHHPSDLNVDHELTARAVLTATRTLPAAEVREVLAFETPSSTEWTFQRRDPVFRATIFFDVTATLERKQRAMQCYGAEMRPFPHPRSREALHAYATRWGSVAGVMAAEAFELIRAVR